MNKDQQNIAIATACGWTCCSTQVFTDLPPHGYPPNIRKPTVQELIDGTAPSPWDIPDYTSDLNAMHEAEKVIRCDPDTEIRYCTRLYKISGCTTFATAAQRAKAFLHTLGLWKPSPQNQTI